MNANSKHSNIENGMFINRPDSGHNIVINSIGIESGGSNTLPAVEKLGMEDSI